LNIQKLANKGALKTKIYVPGKSKKEVEKELNLSNAIKMSSNENTLGSSPKAKQTFLKMKDFINIYPDSLNVAFREKLSSIYDCSVDEITIGDGADGVIYNVGMALIDQNDEVIIPEITFPIYETITKIMRGNLIYSKMRNLRIDLDDINRKITKNTKTIVICNPNNPTGDALPVHELVSFLNMVPENVLIILDEAYIDFTDNSERPDSIKLFKEGMDNLFIIRTLSKLYGLAGIRIGYGIADKNIISLIHRIKPPFDVSIVAENVAISALSDNDFINKTLDNIKREKKFFYKELNSLGLKYIKSHANFILIDTGFASMDVFNRIMKRGVIIRPMVNYNLNTCIRVTIGKHEENLLFFKVFKEVLNEMRAEL